MERKQMKKFVKVIACVCCLLLTSLAVACSTTDDLTKLMKDFSKAGCQEVECSDVTSMQETLDDVVYLSRIYKITAKLDFEDETETDYLVYVYVCEEDADAEVLYAKMLATADSSQTVSKTGNKIIRADYESYIFATTSVKSLSNRSLLG